MFNLHRKVLLAAVVMTTGCATMPPHDEPLKTNAEVAKPLIEQWKLSEPAITYFKTDSAMVIEEPSRIPVHIRDVEIETQLSPNATLSDIAVMFDQLGIYAIIPDEELRNKRVALFAYKGALGNYLDAIASAYDVSFNWRKGNVLTIDKTADYVMRIPQNDELAEKIKESLGALGAMDVSYSVESGSVTYSASYDQHLRIESFMDRLSKNVALVSIQASVVTVALDRNRNTGFDWSALSASFGDKDVIDRYRESQEQSTGTTINNPSTPIDDSSDDAEEFLLSSLGSNLSDSKSVLSLTSGSAGLTLLKGDVSFEAAINFLSTYGSTETKQSVLMKTLSGKVTGIKSINNVPYIDNVGVQSSQNGYTNGTGFGSSKVETLEVGLDLSLKPYYDAESSIVTIDLALSLSSLLGFMELQAGNQLGTVSYPNTQEQTFTDIVKLKAGEPVIVGGITYDQVSDKRSNPSFFGDLPTASKNSTISRNAMFIILMPTVTVFEYKAELASGADKVGGQNDE